MTENRYIETKVIDSGDEQVTVEQAKTYMSVTSSDYDDLITELITVARKRVEDFTHLSLVDKTVTVYIDFAEWRICKAMLPYQPLGSITSVKVIQGQKDDGDPDYLTLDVTNGDYILIGDDICELHSNYSGIHEIIYTTVAKTDASLLLTIKMVTNWLFRNRLDEPAAMPQSIFEHAKPFKIMTWG